MIENGLFTEISKTGNWKLKYFFLWRIIMKCINTGLMFKHIIFLISNFWVELEISSWHIFSSIMHYIMHNMHKIQQQQNEEQLQSLMISHQEKNQNRQIFNINKKNYNHKPIIKPHPNKRTLSI